MKKNRRAFLFDLDFTVLGYSFYPRIYERIIRKCNLNSVDPRGLRELMWAKSRELMHLGRFLDSHDWDYVLDLVLSDLGVVCTVSFSEVVNDDVSSCEVPFKPGAKELLEELKKRGIIVGVLTNGFKKYQEMKVKASGLHKLSDFIVYIDDANSIKPFNEFFRVAFDFSRELEAEPILYMGDNLFFDVIGGLASGIEKVFWYRDKQDVGAGVINLWQIREHLEKIFFYYDGVFPIKDYLDKPFYVINSHLDFLNKIRSGYLEEEFLC